MNPDGFLKSVAIRVAGLLVAGAVVLIILLYAISNTQGSAPEVQLGLVIVLAVFMLMFLLFIMTAGFVQFNLADRTQALGLPEGTIRALIALILIMLFVILGTYLFRTVGEGIVTVRGLTADQVQTLGSRVVSSTPIAGTNTFSVVMQGGISDDGARLGQQLVTTIGTLVVAVAGFYFGTSATAAGASAAAAAQGLMIRTSSQLPQGQAGQQYPGTTLDASGGTPPYKWTLFGGTNLPNGLTLSNTGQISGTPAAGGAASFTVQVEDAKGATATKQFTLTIT